MLVISYNYMIIYIIYLYNCIYIIYIYMWIFKWTKRTFHRTWPFALTRFAPKTCSPGLRGGKPGTAHFWRRMAGAVAQVGGTQGQGWVESESGVVAWLWRDTAWPEQLQKEARVRVTEWWSRWMVNLHDLNEDILWNTDDPLSNNLGSGQTGGCPFPVLFQLGFAPNRSPVPTTVALQGLKDAAGGPDGPRTWRPCWVRVLEYVGVCHVYSSDLWGVPSDWHDWGAPTMHPQEGTWTPNM